ncbi:putative hydroxymethylpyrimidine transporter CytX [Sulfurospirillum diekertiae]|uniref:Hydroxymethylpyrimidine transporter CytX n=1 Tax=Sulfurospirillum diekertiae TaxID=1854492 RepID=A0A6G9VUL5_9BACT|nr:putative hydroxymethylpyrimidine transporter CytX [Sulfurospirillum diekertiae]QIR77085.1 putative hydroxymethylpyrimidine transporter CytX [Sulfurospirillum diekertiae]QIR79699.1 putative hydroxymethylpyrimidine transporter CytX [Sulfurospirillum diekertiae]
MMEEKTSLSGFGLFALWFGAAVSMAEIFTGGLLAPLGFIEGLKAILLGHLIGGMILILGGYIGAKSKLPAIMSTRISFGRYGSYLFSLLNVLQLIGWTAVMIISGGRAANELGISLFGFDSINTWAIAIGILIGLWIWLGKVGFQKLNVVAVVLLFALTLVLCGVVFQEGSILNVMPTDAMSFGSALELSVIMPLSWLPLISDYTRFAKSKKGGLIGSFTGYFIGSSLMYAIGLAIALYAQDASVGTMMMALHLGFAALGIVLLSTITTTFLDAYSAGVTFTNIFPKMSERKIAFVMALLGLVVALMMPIEEYETFLYAIGSVFGPLFAILLSDYFIFKKVQIEPTLALHVGALIVWVIGVGLYYWMMTLDLPLGSTLPTMLATSIIFIITKKVMASWTLKSN